jgi:integrase
MIDKNPAEYVKAPSVDEAEPYVYANEELRRIRAAVRTDLEEVIFYGFANTGLRRCELCKLKPEAHADIDRRGNRVNYVDFERQEIKVIGKRGKFRKVPLHPTLAEAWAAHLRRNPDSKTILGKGGSPRNVNERVEQLLRRAGVDGGNRPAHKFRARVQTVLCEEGVRTDVIDKMLGWAPSSVRQRYYSRVRDEAMYEAILKLYVSDSIERAPLDAQGSMEESEAAAA